MTKPLAVLIVEDCTSDAALMVRHLQKAGFDVVHQRVESAEQMHAALRAQPWDLVLSDFAMPGFDARRALMTLQDSGLDIPFVIVSGTIGDETAIELMRTGARDYLMKNNIVRLASVVERELLEARQRRQCRAAEERLRLSARVFESAEEGIILTDNKGKILALNPAFEKITGYRESEELGRYPRILKSSHQNAAFYRNMRNSLQAQGHWAGEIWNQRKNGELYPAWLTLSIIKNESACITHHVGLLSDRSAIFQAQERVDFLSHHDLLTDLPNGVLLRDRLQHAIKAATVNHSQVALMLLSIDRIQRVNDSFGHEVGDALIKELACRLLAKLVPGDTLARLGSGKFVLVLTDFADADDIMVIAVKLLAEIAKPFRVQNEDVSVTASIGITVYPDDGIEFTDLLKGADTVLSLIKNEGRSGVRFFTTEMNTRAQRRMALENRLRYAIERDELLLHYQPQMSLQHGHICGIEALIRWRSPDLGLISPADFIPLAEDAGLIALIGTWVMHSACAQNKAWQNAGLPPVRIAVNVSAHQFGTGALTSLVRKALQETGLAPQYLEVELTESVLMNDTESSLTQITELRQMGISVSLDDFGTGYSSLSYLSRFPIDKLKIDQGFIRNITSDPRSAAIANASIALSRSLGITVIAEGVETEGQLDYLRKAGCDEIQGYLFSRPLPPDAVARFMAETVSRQGQSEGFN